MTDPSDFTEPLSRREREKAQHRREIIDAAITVFSEKGYHEATLDEIAQKAEFSKGALYLYFQNKEDILYVALKESLEEQNANLQNLISGKREFREELRMILVHLAEDIFREPNIFSLINAQHAALFTALSEENRHELFLLHNALWDQLGKRVVQAIERKEIRPFVPEAVIGMIQGTMASMVMDRWHCATLDELKAAIDVFIEMIFNGIAYRKE